MKFIVLGSNGPQLMKLNRRKAIRERCLNCTGWISSEVRNCHFNRCSLHKFRMGVGKQESIERAAAIRNYCLQCCNDQPNEVRLCPCKDCSLYPFRFYKIDRTVEINSKLKKHHIAAFAKDKI